MIYLNGDYVAQGAAKMSIFDRGFLFADSVYEVVAVLGARLVDFEAHIARLENSLRELEIEPPLSYDKWLQICRALIAQNEIEDGLIYMHITRGTGQGRDFAYPLASPLTPNVVSFAQSRPELVDNPQAQSGLKMMSLADLRWHRRDIKTTQLLYATMGKMMARKAGCDDVWFVEGEQTAGRQARDALVTEGTSHNAYIVKQNRIITRALSRDILSGVTRAAVLGFARAQDIAIEERGFSVAEAQAADEAFITSASSFVLPVIALDGVRIGTGAPGAVTSALRAFYIEESRKSSI